MKTPLQIHIKNFGFSIKSFIIARSGKLMNNEYLVLGGLAVVMGIVLFGPFLHKKVEEELETFLFIMGIVSVSISRLWSWHLIREALVTPIEISLAVLIAGLGFRAIRPKLHKWTDKAVQKFGYSPMLVALVAGLGTSLKRHYRHYSGIDSGRSCKCVENVQEI